MFLTEDNSLGCAETSYLILCRAYGLHEASDPSPAMALNGGLAWQGGACGALLGAAVAVGRFAGHRLPDHAHAKRCTRGLVAALVHGFGATFGAVNCRAILGLDISTRAGHADSLRSLVWHRTCMGQIEFVVGYLVGLQDTRAWQDALARLQADSQ